MWWANLSRLSYHFAMPGSQTDPYNLVFEPFGKLGKVGHDWGICLQQLEDFEVFIWNCFTTTHMQYTHFIQ